MATLNPKARIEAVCSKDEDRYSINRVYLDVQVKDDPRIVATDGHALVALKTTLHENDAGGYIATEALKAFRKGRFGGEAHLTCNGKCGLPDGSSFPRPSEDASFPDWRWVLPKEPETEASIAFDVDLLKKIVDAAGGDSTVRLRFDAKDSFAPIRVDVKDAPDAIAVLMPFRW